MTVPTSNTSLLFFPLRVLGLLTTSCLLDPMRSSLGYVLKGSYMARYPFSVLKLVPLLKRSNYSGLYSGIFNMYLQLERPPNKSRTESIIFYALCVLYVLSTVNVILDLVIIIFEEVSTNNTICFIINQLCKEFVGCTTQRLIRITHWDSRNGGKRLL